MGERDRKCIAHNGEYFEKLHDANLKCHCNVTVKSPKCSVVPSVDADVVRKFD